MKSWRLGGDALGLWAVCNLAFFKAATQKKNADWISAFLGKNYFFSVGGGGGGAVGGGVGGFTEGGGLGGRGGAGDLSSCFFGMGGTGMGGVATVIFFRGAFLTPPVAETPPVPESDVGGGGGGGGGSLKNPVMDSGIAS